MPASGLAVRRLVPVAITDQRAAVTRAREPGAQFVIDNRTSYLDVIGLGRPLNENDWREFDRIAHLAQAHGAVLAVPLIVDGKARGTITLFYPEPRDFGDEDVQLSNAFADQAAQAIENARLRNEAEERFRELQALYSADATLHRSLQLNEVLEALVGVAVDILSADNSAVFVWDTDRSSLAIGAAVGFPPGSTDDVSFAPGEGAVGYVAVTGETVAVPDIQADERASQRFAGELGIRAGLHVPVTVGGEIFGVFTVGSRRARSFSVNERRVLAGLAQRAGAAIENARLHGESEQRRAELTALYQADEALHRSLRLNDVLETLLDVAQHLLHADGVGVWGRDPDQPDNVAALASRGLSADFLRETIEITRDARIHTLGSTDETLVSEDCVRDERFPARLRAALQREGYRAIISTQVAVGEQVYGTFSVGMRAAHKFSESEKRVMSALSARAAQAIQNARRHEESEQQRRELQALYGADEALHRSLRLNDVLEALVDAATGLLRADCGGLWGPDPRNASRMVPLASRGLSADYLKESVRLNDEPGVLEYWWSPDPDVVAVEDISRDPRLPPAQRTALEREGCRSFLSIQVRAGDQQFGSFTVGHRAPHRYSEPEQRLLVALGQRAAVAIQNARLYEQVQQAAAMEERQRLARELHDAVTQTLFTTALIAEVLPELWELDAQEGQRQLVELRRLTRGALAEMRTLLIELRPAALTEMQLADLLRQLAEASAGRTRLEVDVQVGGQPRQLPPEIQVAFYRLAQEALNNVVKHAHAGCASIELEYVGDDALRLSVTDDGRGFNQSNVAAGHLGLGIMRERSRAIGASFQLDSRPGEGTSIHINWRQTEVSPQ
jgi:GAF domain-containing protein/anti-sigma regulatory factor (Ser/Thr protein kinase)